MLHHLLSYPKVENQINELKPNRKSITWTNISDRNLYLYIIHVNSLLSLVYFPHFLPIENEQTRIHFQPAKKLSIIRHYGVDNFGEKKNRQFPRRPLAINLRVSIAKRLAAWIPINYIERRGSRLGRNALSMNSIWHRKPRRARTRARRSVINWSAPSSITAIVSLPTCSVVPAARATHAPAPHTYGFGNSLVAAVVATNRSNCSI